MLIQVNRIYDVDYKSNSQEYFLLSVIYFIQIQYILEWSFVLVLMKYSYLHLYVVLYYHRKCTQAGRQAGSSLLLAFASMVSYSWC
jgi:hypothetical protein